MNQILMINNNGNNSNNYHKKEKKSTGGSIEISSIVRFFAVTILLFGLVLASSGTYAMILDKQESANSITPEVKMERLGNSVNITVTSTKGIRTVTYNWNESAPTVTQGGNKTEVKLSVTIPSGSNQLNLSVVDSDGKLSRFVKNYVQSEGDVTEPKIELEVVNSNLKIVVTDDTALDYIVYKFGDADEVRVDATEENPTKIEVTIPVGQGQSTLTIEAVDKAQNIATKEQEVKGATKPVVEVSPDPNDPSYLIIKATDAEGLRMISFYINGQEYSTDPNTSLGTTDFEYKIQVQPGENNVTVHAYNINEQVTEFVGVYNY